MLSIRRRTLLLTILLCFTVGVGSVQVQPFTGQIQQALQILGLWPYGIYGNGSVPTWNSTLSQFQPGGGSGGSSSATQFISTAGTTCAAPALTSTAGGTNGIAISATAVLTCVGGTARQTATATSWTTTVPMLGPNGSASAPSYSFASEPTFGLYKISTTELGIGSNGSTLHRWRNGDYTILNDSGAILLGSSADVSISRGAANVLALATGDSFNMVGGGGSFRMANVPIVSSTAPTITSAGTNPSVVGTNTAAFRVNVGTGGAATTIVMAMPAATTGWNCHADNITAGAANRANQRVIQQSSTTTAVTVQNQTISTGAALAFTANDIVAFVCMAY